MKKTSTIKIIVVLLSLFLDFGNKMIPPALGLTPIGVSVLCIFVATILQMLFLDNIIATFLSVLAFTQCGVWEFGQTLTNYFGTNLFWFMVALFVVMVPIEESGLIRRIAIWFLTRDITKKNPWFFVIMLFITSFVIGSFINSSALIVIIISLTAEVLGTLGIVKGHRTGELLILGVLFVIGVSHAATPIGHPTTVAMMSLLGDLGSLDYLKEMIVGILFTAMFVAILVVLMKFVFKLDVSGLSGYDPEVLKKELGPFTKKEKVSAWLLALMVILWILPSILGAIAPDAAAWMNRFNTSGPVIVIALLFTLFKDDEGKPIMVLNDALKKIPWQAAMVNAVASGLSTAFNHPDGNVKEFFGAVFGDAVSGLPDFVVILVLALLCTIMSGFASNIVSGTISSTIMYTLIRAGLVGVNPVAFCCVMCICAPAGFATAPANAYSSVTVASGWTKPGSQLKKAIFMEILVAILASTVGYALGLVIA